MAHVWADAAELNGELVERILDHRQRAQAKPGQMSAAGTDSGQFEFCGRPGDGYFPHV